MKNFASTTLMFLALISTPAFIFATVDSFIGYTVPYQEIQSDGICMKDMTMKAEIGIPASSRITAVFSPALIFSQNIGQENSYININILGEGIEAEMTDEEYTGTKVVYTFELDFAELTAKNGESEAGRIATIKAAKLAVISIIENLNRDNILLPEQAFITMKNLPSQWKLEGSRVYPTTMYPYSKFSSFYTTYKNELINLDGTCE